MGFTEISTAETPTYIGMAWYRFLTSIGLIAGAVLNFLLSLAYFSGSIYSYATGGEVTAEQVYAYYGTTLYLIDFIYGIMIISLALLALILRYKLANFEPDTMTYVYIFYSLSLGAPILYFLLSVAFLKQSVVDGLSIPVFASIVISFVHIKYFKQRAHLFIGKTETSDDLVQSAPSTYTNPYTSNKTDNNSRTTTDILVQESHPMSKSCPTSANTERIVQSTPDDIYFCRNCGTKVLNDSTFCHKCGKKIR